ncbi:gluconate 2-dehydrogenase subunit 3 family protein [Microvirga sp. STS02]|uniref:gluconate 2-dehydrogenase subunit 3 family protein n=1 Tax=Hymenobacter negativus TaxID=2795026 RepID=UPI0018DB8805|nr:MULTISPECIES: gluconate 2-dehydrogenase subunit 3 family protein [Bacteria]MBH8570797.1 gluconate 2-dehydrogenase subunit 3 family protein [Hymenobacter negativus]MBR7210534.1 gluconate 2-dehydrogenase subunit 3 family protein [Microvirga sp. STS02]
MSVPTYPSGTVRALLATPHVSEATRTAVQARLDAPAYTPQFLAPETYALLEAVADRLFPQPDRPEQPIPLAPAVDQRLTEGRADGWRYDALPPDREAYRLGLGGIQEIAQAQFQTDFTALSAEQQDAVLQVLAAATPPGKTWETLDAGRFFEEMLAELTETYYAHPLAQEEIGYVGMADLPAWTKIGLNEREEREPA